METVKYTGNRLSEVIEAKLNGVPIQVQALPIPPITDNCIACIFNIKKCKHGVPACIGQHQLKCLPSMRKDRFNVIFLSARKGVKKPQVMKKSNKQQ